MKLPRRRFLHLAVGAAALPAVSRIARAQAYPARQCGSSCHFLLAVELTEEPGSSGNTSRESLVAKSISRTGRVLGEPRGAEPAIPRPSESVTKPPARGGVADEARPDQPARERGLIEDEQSASTSPRTTTSGRRSQAEGPPADATSASVAHSLSMKESCDRSRALPQLPLADRGVGTA